MNRIRTRFGLVSVVALLAVVSWVSFMDREQPTPFAEPVAESSGLLAPAELLQETEVRTPVLSPGVGDLAASIAGLQDAVDALAYFRTLAPEDREAALQVLLSIDDAVRRQILLIALFRPWTEDDPNAAMEAAASSGESSLTTESAFEAWAFSDPEAAWNRTSPAEFRISDLFNGYYNRLAVVRTVSKNDGESMIGRWLLETGGDLASEFADVLMELWIPKDAQAAGDWLWEYTRAYPDRSEIPEITLGRVGAELSPEEFDVLLATQDEAFGNIALKWAIIEWLVAEQTGRLEDFIANHPDMSDGRNDVILTQLGSFTRPKDPELARQIFLSIRSPEARELALYSASVIRILPLLGSDAFIQSSEEGVRIALLMNNEVLQTEALTQNFEEWVWEDLDAARAYFEQAELSPDLRAKLLESVPKLRPGTE